MSPTSYRAAPPRGDFRRVPDPREPVNNMSPLRPRRSRHVPIPRVRPRAAGGQVLRLDRGDLVRGDTVLGDLRLQVVEPRRVATEDGLLHRAVRRPKWRESVRLLPV